VTRRSHQLIVERGVLDLRPDAGFAAFARARELRDTAGPSVLGNLELVALEQHAQGFDVQADTKLLSNAPRVMCFHGLIKFQTPFTSTKRF
jgi:hypothetical protein